MKNKQLEYNESIISFGPITESKLNDILKSEGLDTVKKVIITDENVSEIWIEHLITSFEELFNAEIIVLPAGEENKGLEICAQVWNALSEYNIGRNDIIINFGGGVITDMGGFIASTFKRGLSFINIPTTLLSQVDASVGGKTGIDLGPYKNQIGLFADAKHVFIDTSFLSTLPETELVSGYVEMLKHGLIADADYWNDLKSINPCEHPENLLDTVFRSVELKKNIVTKDHKETGIRKLLNFGHSIGHAIEGYCLEQEKPIPHGYGVAWGILAESWLALQLSLINVDVFHEIETVIDNLNLPLEIPSTALPRLLDLIKNDKKNKGERINFTLISAIGEGIHDQYIDLSLIEKAFLFILDRAANRGE